MKEKKNLLHLKENNKYRRKREFKYKVVSELDKSRCFIQASGRMMKAKVKMWAVAPRSLEFKTGEDHCRNRRKEVIVNLVNAIFNLLCYVTLFN